MIIYFKCSCGVTIHLNTKEPNKIKEIDKICLSCWKKSFICWFVKEYQYEWDSSYSSNELFAHEASKNYEFWCKENDIKPIWNG